MLKKKGKNDSRWTVKASIVGRSKDGRTIRVRLKTQPLPPNPLSDKHIGDPHPFSQLGEEYYDDNVMEKSVVAKGVYQQYVADNVVTQTIMDIIGNQKKLNKASGNVDWRWYRMMLVRILDMLWD